MTDTLRRKRGSTTIAGHTTAKRKTNKVQPYGKGA